MPIVAHVKFRFDSDNSKMRLGCAPGMSLPPDLTGDRRVGDLRVSGQQERLAEDHAQQRVVVERQEQLARLPVAGRDDAQVLVVGRHEDVPAAIACT